MKMWRLKVEGRKPFAKREVAKDVFLSWREYLSPYIYF
jgi:hypothetical protein